MKYLIILLIPIFSFAAETTPMTIFLKQGYSSILEFDKIPTQVVLGDTQSFQVEKLNRSLVIRPLTTDVTSNMFVYFNSGKTKLFILSVSDEANPTLYKKIISFDPPKRVIKKIKPIHYRRAFKVISSSFNNKKDHLKVKVQISADKTSKITPLWNQVWLTNGKFKMKASTLWSSRPVVQKDSKVNAQFIFQNPDVPRNLKDTYLHIPVVETKKIESLSLYKGKK